MSFDFSVSTEVSIHINYISKQGTVGQSFILNSPKAFIDKSTYLRLGVIKTGHNHHNYNK